MVFQHIHIFYEYVDSIWYLHKDPHAKSSRQQALDQSTILPRIRYRSLICNPDKVSGGYCVAGNGLNTPNSHGPQFGMLTAQTYRIPVGPPGSLIST